MKKLSTGITTCQKGKEIIVLSKEETRQKQIEQESFSNMLYVAMMISISIVTGMIFLTLF